MSTLPPLPAAAGDSEPASPTLPGTARDSEPASPTLPGAALWSDSDPPTTPADPPAAAFSGLVAKPSDGTMPTIGHIGRYALKYQLGEGGLGTVFAAHDPLLSRLIAVKTLNVQVADSERESFNALFINEARAAGGLSHPHIVTVFDAGISDQRAYIAMELLKGRDLRQLRQEGWRATPAQAALIVRRVADALAFAHSKGVIHRDIKPANIFMVGRTQPRVLDFGIARVAHRQGNGSDPHSGAGSPYYMAPEQVRRQTTDRRADVFSLGVVLYELLTDSKPFRGETLGQIRDAVVHHEPPPANMVDPAVPKALAEIVARAMAKDPEHRFRSARSFARELRQWLDENPGAPDHEVTVPPPAPTRRRVLVAAVALGLALLTGGGLWYGLSSKPGEVVAAAPAETRPTTSADSFRAAAPEPVAMPTAVAPTPEASSPAASAASNEAVAVTASPAAAPEPTPIPDAARPIAAATPAAAVAPTAAPVAATTAIPATAKPPRETAKDRRTRETREREVRESESRITAAASLVAPPTGTVRIAVSPWGQVEVDGASSGITPPITELVLAEGRHQIVVRNGDFAPYTTSINVVAGQSVTLRHRFGP